VHEVDAETRARQQGLIRKVLEPLPSALRAEVGEEALFEIAVEEAPAIFRSLDAEWEVFLAAEAEVDREARSPFNRVLRALDSGSGIFGAVGFAMVLVLLATSEVALDGSLPVSLAIVGATVGAAMLVPRAWVGYLALLGRAFGTWRRSEAREWVANRESLLRDLGLWLISASLITLTVVGGLDGRMLRRAETTVALTVGASLLLPMVVGRLWSAYGPLLDAERFSAIRRRFEQRLRRETLRVLRERLNREIKGLKGKALTYSDLSGLAEIDDGTREIDTGVKSALIRKMRLMPGGTIGLAGPRGAGKSTLMRSICAVPSTRAKKEGPLSVVVDAPAHYEARDFVLYLFARVCSEVVGRDRVREMRGSDRPFGAPVANPWGLLARSESILALGCLLSGTALMALVLLHQTGALSSPFGWGAFLFTVGYCWLLLRVIGDQRRRRHLEGGSGSGQAEDEGSGEYVKTATVRLRQIWFQQSFSSGWSGTFEAPVGVSAELAGGTDLAEQQMSFPDIVDLFRDFLGQVALYREVRIGIDEMDKMDDDAASRFLNEIKVIFRIPDCFFFVSISEDAMSVFERRGLPLRDVFDSSFDDVQHVPCLEFPASRELLEQRTVGLPVSFCCLLHCIAGGLPRDLVRAARDLVENDKGTPLTTATTLLLRKSLKAKAEGVKIVARGFEEEELATILVVWLDLLPLDTSKASTLDEFCERFRTDILEPIASLSEDEELRTERRRATRLCTQLIAFAYHSATVMRFFAQFDESRSLKGSAVPTTDPRSALSPVDQLALVTQTFAVDIYSAWTMLSRFRDDFGLGDGIDFPYLHLAPSLASRV
jgi:energy-coupling factor transporter ATP-binding protein EcfA2